MLHTAFLMLNKLISYLPRPIHQRMRALVAARRSSPFEGLDRKSVFTRIYESDYWRGGESKSGSGSDLDQTRDVIRVVNQLIREHRIKSILDIPCGDFHWMQHVDLTGVRYIGADIVEPLVEENQKRYSRSDDKGGSISFRTLDLAADALPKVDLVIVRDALVHLSFNEAEAAIDNIIDSNSAYLLATTFPKHLFNYDITTGDWRALNLQKEPFLLNEPMAIYPEKPLGTGKEYSDKSLGLWKIPDM